jgi:hypothetical protein
MTFIMSRVDIYTVIVLIMNISLTSSPAVSPLVF